MIKRNDYIIKTNRSEYDFIVSLGGNCGVAGQLRHRGLRTCSFPLDWTLMTDVRPVRYLPHGLKSRFSDFCLCENMVEFEPPANEYGKMKYRLEDSLTGFRFIHHFTAPPSNEVAFKKSRAVLQRRIDRFYEIITKAKHVLFILETSFPYDFSLLDELYRALIEVFPNTKVELVAMQFSAKTCQIADLQDGNVHVLTSERFFNIVYDTQLTAHEWCFMDQLSLHGKLSPYEMRKKQLLTKWKYKLWMWLGRSLEHSGAGCANMRFYKFDRYS